MRSFALPWRFLNTRVPANPRTTFHLGQIEGGHVRSIPFRTKRASKSTSLRNEDELLRLENRSPRMFMDARMCATKMEPRDDRPKAARMEIHFGTRTGGELAADSPLLPIFARPMIHRNQHRAERLPPPAQHPPLGRLGRYCHRRRLATAAERIRFRNGTNQPAAKIGLQRGDAHLPRRQRPRRTERELI